jgi:ribosomal-protein-alanine N-acetyltransferase
MIELRDFTLDDAGSLVENGNNPKVARFLREVFPSPYTMDDANWWVSEGYKLDDSRNVAVDFEGQCIGGAGLQFQQNENQYSCELGYWLGEPHWGKGIATCVVAKLKKLAFSEHEVKRLYGPVAGGNNASIRVLEKNGFILEGIMRKHLYLRGTFYDEHIYATYS